MLGSGAVLRSAMARAGLWLDRVGIGLVTGLLDAAIPPLPGIAP